MKKRRKAASCRLPGASYLGLVGRFDEHATVTREITLSQNALMLGVDFEGAAVHANSDMVFVGQVGGYSPRVPAGEASTILELILGHRVAVGGGDGEFRFTGPLALDLHVGTDFVGHPNQR